MNHRTALIVAASIAALVLAAALAVAVNLGILTVADSAPVGQLTAATVAQSSAAPAQLAAGAQAPAPAQRQTQDYVIRKAGTVRIAFSRTAVRFVDASPKPGWTWKLSQTRAGELTVTFARGSDKYTFVAGLDRRGKLSARVDHPVTQVASSGGSASWTVAPAASASGAAGEPDEGGYPGGEADD